MIIRETGALSFRILFNFMLLTLCVAAMLASLSALGLGTLALASATTMVLLALVTLHLALISKPYVPAAVMAERAEGVSR